MNRCRHIVICLLLAAPLTGCGGGDALDAIRDRGELVVATRNGPSTYYIDKGEQTGFEHALVSLFAEELGVSVRYKVLHNIDDILDSVRRDQADLAAAGLTVTESRATEFRFSLPYYAIDPQVIYVAGTARPRSLSDLVGGRIVTMASSSHAEFLGQLQEDLPDLDYQEIRDAEPLDLMDMVSSGAATYAIIDSNEYVANRAFHPNLRVGFTLGNSQRLAWLFSNREEDKAFRERVNDFLARVSDDGTLDRLKELQFGHAWGIDQVDSMTFKRRMRERLPTYEDMIRQVAREYQMDWHLLAAIAYQESHWNPKARSPTGVRGMMMLTSNTAREMGVKDRLDALQSLRGGARYFKKTRRLLPNDIYEPDRTWFALAAYNIGRGHLEDARVITERQGGDPHLWSEVRERLPLLQRAKYYKTVRYGYARGNEPVSYVKNVRHYYNLLAWEDIAANRQPPPIEAEEYLPESVRRIDFTAL